MDCLRRWTCAETFGSLIVVRRSAKTVACAVGAMLLVLAALPAGASALTRTVVVKSDPITVGGYQVALQGRNLLTKAPKIDGYITHMETDVVDVKTGAKVPINRIMLHHIVFVNLGPNAINARSYEPFYGDGEERAKMDLPAGYGYPITKDDVWAWVWMLMNHKPVEDSVRIQWTMTIVTGETLKSVKPIVWDTSHGRDALIFDVPGGGPAGSVDTRTSTRTMPASGRLVAGLGHVHGGAIDLKMTQPSCGGRTIYDSRPTWGLTTDPFYQVRPVLHEPGPINMSQFRSGRGIPVVAGERINVSSNYDNTRPHTRSMGLLLAYLYPDSSVTAQSCQKLPSDYTVLKTRAKGRAKAPAVTVGIYDWSGSGVTKAKQVLGPPGAMTIAPADTTVEVKDFAFKAGNLTVKSGASVTWKFDDPVQHNVTLANGPEGFSSNRLQNGATFTKKLTKPGTYRFFCELHPVGMIQRIVVKP
jgi:plastocyanin